VTNTLRIRIQQSFIAVTVVDFPIFFPFFLFFSFSPSLFVPRCPLLPMVRPLSLEEKKATLDHGTPRPSALARESSVSRKSVGNNLCNRMYCT